MNVNYKKEISNEDIEKVVKDLTGLLQKEGFGILTRIDFHSKIKEKLAKEIPPTIILGACNPQLAYEIFTRNADITALMPCNAVVRSLGQNRISVELARPITMVDILGDPKIKGLADEADMKFKKILEEIH